MHWANLLEKHEAVDHDGIVADEVVTYEGALQDITSRLDLSLEQILHPCQLLQVNSVPLYLTISFYVEVFSKQGLSSQYALAALHSMVVALFI